MMMAPAVVATSVMSPAVASGTADSRSPARTGTAASSSTSATATASPSATSAPTAAATKSRELVHAGQFTRGSTVATTYVSP